MDRARALVYGTVALIAAATLASGPLFGVLDVTRSGEEEAFAPGTGTLDATVVELPDDPRLDRGDYGSETYYLKVPDATVDSHSVVGQPMLVYKIRIPDLGHVRSTVHFLDSDWTGRKSVELERSTLAPDAVTRESYPAELLVLVRDDAGERTLGRANVTVTVDDE